MGKESLVKMNAGDKPSERMLMNMASQIISRAAMASKLGKSYGGDRDIYTALGYNKNPQFNDFYTRYQRQDVAKRIVKAPVSSSWRQKPLISEMGDEETAFEKAWSIMVKDKNIFHYLTRADRISGIGKYGILLMGFSDGKPLKEQVEKADQLLYLRPYSEASAEITEWEKDANNERYGKPVIYKLQPASADRGQSLVLNAHHSRVIHIAEESEEDDVYGTPRMLSVLNRLQDLELISGGSAEMFWRGAFPGMGFKAEDGAQWDPQSTADLQSEIEDYMHGLKRYIRLKGVEVDEFSMQVSDPSNHVSILLDLISGATGIPKRILIGSERGELASSQDENNWNSRIDERRVDHCEPMILRPFIDKQIEVGTLPPPTSKEYEIEWPPLTSPDEEQQATVSKLKTEALAKYAGTPGADLLIPPEFFYKKFMGLNEEEIEQINEMVDGMLDDERSQIMEERTQLDKEREEMSRQTPPPGEEDLDEE